MDIETPLQAADVMGLDIPRSTGHDGIVAALAASGRLAQALLLAHGAGLSIIMTYAGQWSRDRLDGLWMPQVVMDGIHPSVQVRALGATARWPRRAHTSCPEAFDADDESAEVATAIQKAFSAIPTDLFVDWAPGYFLQASKDVHVTMTYVDASKALMVALRDDVKARRGA